jgi:hypothetical protein
MWMQSTNKRIKQTAEEWKKEIVKHRIEKLFAETIIKETAKKILEELKEITISDGHFGLTMVIDTDDWNAFLARWTK